MIAAARTVLEYDSSITLCKALALLIVLFLFIVGNAGKTFKQIAGEPAPSIMMILLGVLVWFS